ncbi:hypothetical protein BD408DRAFT_419127 [Parasitella parasitica]|nr:hypothetical protein BD408DRAFT_419127 [Parasitella parasitica]
MTRFLPAELWVKIFNNIDSFKQLEQCSLVCKKWDRLIETAILSTKSITMHGESEAMTFCSYLTRNPDKSYLIKHLTVQPLHCRLDYFREVSNLAVTSNLETYDGAIEGTQFFRALRQIVDSRCVKKLRIIPAAWSHSNVYDKLLYLLRHSLEDVKLTFRGTDYESASMMNEWVVPERLDDFEKLKSLTFNSYIHDIEDTEDVLKGCNRLQELTVHLPYIDEPQDIRAWMKETVKRNETLKTFKIKIGQDYQAHLLDYFIYKYPKIETIVIEKINTREAWGLSYYTHTINIQEVREILGKIRAMPSFILKCLVPQNEIQEIITLLKSDGYNASEGHYIYKMIETALLQVSSSDAVSSEITSVVRRPPPLHLS